MAKTQVRTVVIDYEPRKPQRELHDAIALGKHRHYMCVWHRRAGKTVGWVNQLIKCALTIKRNDGRYAYIAPMYRQAKAIAWDYVKRFSKPIPGVTINESELRIDYPNGSRLQLFGADNPDSLRGMYFDGVAIDEYGQIHPRLRSEILIPALADRQGFEIVGGTPQGRNQFHRLYERATQDEAWWVSLRRASDTKILPQEILDEAREEIDDQDVYDQEFECSWAAAARGSYYGKKLDALEKQGHIGNVPYDPLLPVLTSWDLGMNDLTSIWFIQRYGFEFRAIDYYENSGEGLQHYANVLQSKKYLYHEHIAPHDIQVRELGTGKSRYEVAQQMGIHFRIAPGPNSVDVNDGIEAVRNLLPFFWFDREKCRDGLEALWAYKKEYNEKTGTYNNRPLHDWASHPADALRHMAISSQVSPTKQPTRTRPDISWIT